jgi:hypothetical protein
MRFICVFLDSSGQSGVTFVHDDCFPAMHQSAIGERLGQHDAFRSMSLQEGKDPKSG